MLIPADPGDPIVGEAAVISQTSVAGPITTLSFVQPLARIYDRATVAVNANAVAATHGETMHEILGSGDATNAALQFTLKQSPLDVRRAPRPARGRSSTLQVWVNNLLWQEVDNFLASGPTDRVFVTQTDQHGSGHRPVRRRHPGVTHADRADEHPGGLPQGDRVGGQRPAGQLSQPLDRPQGLKGVTNPDPATGRRGSRFGATTPGPAHRCTC